MEYNSTRPKLIISEYGRNIQKMVDYVKTIEDREKRNKLTEAIITVMGQLNPHLRDVEDFKHKLYDHLHIMSNFELDVDAPYPKPAKETFEAKPEKVPYPSSDIKYGHYGKIIQKFINQAAEELDEEKRSEMGLALANLMKRSYLEYNRDSVRDDMIVEQLEQLSKGKVSVKNPESLTSTYDILGKPSSDSSQFRRKKKTTNNKYRKKGKF
jgi:hypothetical protein